MTFDRCKSCGGELERIGNYYVCKFCGNKWMIDADNDVHVIDRANAWSALRDCDFERSVELFENIIFKEPENHEAYWGRALASAGIMYVTDLNEHKKVPTCNSISEESFTDSRDVQKAIALAPEDIAETYRRQAAQIEAIRVEWVRKARKEKPYDVFICFKDSDREHNIERTDDSYDAQELYFALIEEGYRVFFSRVSLRDKVSEHYEPYIYNALKTAKVMIVFGEKPEYFNAVWVKNEWTRFRAMIERGEKHRQSMVVVYKNLTPSELPAGLRSRQCLNASSFTFFQDLKAHILKIKQSSRNASNTREKEPIKPVVIDPLHEHIYRDKIVSSTCVAKGYTLHICDCGYEYRDSYMPLVDHKFKTTDMISPGCQADGREEKECDVCGEKTSVRIPALGHQFTKWVETMHSTCTEGGEIQRQCSECGHIEKKVTAATGHHYGAWVTAVDGKQTCDCINCGHTQTRENRNYGSYIQSSDSDSKEEGNVISLKNIFRNWIAYKKSFWTKETTKAQKWVRLTGHILFWSLVALFIMGINSSADNMTTIPSDVFGTIAIVFSFDAILYIGALLVRSAEKGKSKLSGLPLKRNAYVRTWLKFISAVLFLVSVVMVAVPLSSNDSSMYPLIMMGFVCAVWAIVASFMSHCPQKCQMIQIGRGVAFKKRKLASCAVFISIAAIFAMLVWAYAVSEEVAQPANGVFYGGETTAATTTASATTTDSTKANVDMTTIKAEIDSKKVSDFKETTKTTEYVKLTIKDYGDVVIRLRSDVAPITVKNFQDLVKDGFYDGLTFHRIYKGFMIQGGDPKGDGTGGSGTTIKGEFKINGVQNDLSHVTGVISMARRSSSYDSATSQFFICNDDSAARSLDGSYAAFGYVVAGLDVVLTVSEVEVTANSFGEMSRPVETVVIEKVCFVNPK